MSPELWVIVIGQAISIGVTVGVYVKSMRVVEKEIHDLQDTKVEKDVYRVDIIRIDDNVRTVAHRVSNIDQRVHGMEVKR